MTDAQTPATPEPATPATQAIAAGWYPDPSYPAQQRWWDGTRWSEQVSAPYVAAGQASGAYVAAQQLTAPAGTKVQTPWIWLNVLLPLLSLVSLFSIDMSGMMRDLLADPSNPSSQLEAQFALYTSPSFLITSAISWLIIAATIVFAFLDWRELKRRGVPAPFHWAFSFLGLVGLLGVVYPIGRSVVVKRRTGTSDRVLLATILVIVVYVIAVIVFTVLIFNQVFAYVLENPGLQP